ncbi:unnamed protein product [Auanema sp. JU1783]|nr:unnamed protein product [Auanema sp. JU1783]
MWFEERSWSNLRMSDLVEEWRDLWSFKIDFLVAGLSYVFATTNLLNLPKLILENGGVAFIAAYGAAVLALVLPTIVLELAVGQLTGRAPVSAFYSLSPVFKGVGVSQVLFSLLVLCCMTRVLAWLCLYLFQLVITVQKGRPGLPWLNCLGFPEMLSQPCLEAGALANSSTTFSTKLNVVNAQSSLMQFMTFHDNPTDSVVEFGEFQYYLLAAQGLVWFLVFAAICFGVRWLGKVIPFFFMGSFSIMLTLFVRSWTLGGLPEILNVYWVATDWNRLADYHVWKLAVEQAILATGIGFGAFISIASYNKRSNNLVGDSILIVFGHCVLTAMQVAVVVGLVGFVSMKTGLSPLEVMDKGENQMWHILTYFSYVPNTKLWSALFLVASVFVLLNVFYLLSISVLSTLEDALGEKWSRCFPRFVLAMFTCGLVFSMSLYFSTQAGRHAYELVTGFMKYITIFVILAFELFATAWFYCAHRLGMDLHTMLRRACCWCLGHFILLFTYLLPVLPAGVAVLNAMSYDFSSFSPAIHAWPWSEYVGAACAIVPLIPIPLFFFGALLKACCCRDTAGNTKGQRLKNTVTTRLRRDHSHPYSHEKAPPPRYTGSAPGYLLLPQAPLAEPETYA